MATTTTTTSFSNTPQAMDDYYFGYNENWTALIYLDVMANDLGGKAKTLYSLDDGTITSDLLGQDTARAESMSSDYSKYGAHLWITSDGKVGYDVNTATFQNTVQNLASGEHLTDIFTYAIRLGNGALSWATTYVDFIGVNDAPEITSGNFSGMVTEQITPMGDLMANGLINFKDLDLSDIHSVSPNGTPIGSVLGSLTASLVQDIDHMSGMGGQLSWQYTVADSAVEYLAAGETKIEKFNVMVSDNHGGSVMQEIDVTITGTNDAPIISDSSSDFSGQVTEMIAPVGMLIDTGLINFGDVDLSDLHSVSVSPTDSNPRLGVLAALIGADSTGDGSGQVSWTYEVSASAVESLAKDELKVESFTVTVMDNNGAMVSRQVDITIIGTNDAPIAVGESYSVNEDTLLNISAAAGVLANDTDIDHNAMLSALLVSGPEHALSFSLNADGSFSYQAALNYNGPDSFSYKANDGLADSNVVTVNLTVSPVNDAPIAVGESYSVDEDTLLNISAAAGVLANDSDVDNASLSALLVSGPAHALSFSLNADGSFSYQAASNYNGPDSFSYKANDGSLNSNIVTVSINVILVNDAPIAVGESYSVNEDMLLSVAAAGVLGNDSDGEGDMLSAILFLGPAHALSFSLNADGSFSYQAASNYNGPDSFSYRAFDGAAFSDPVLVSINVVPVNDAPVAVGDFYTTNEDTLLNITSISNGVLQRGVDDSDVDTGDVLTAILVSNPLHAESFTFNSDGTFSYMPSDNYNGSDSFTYKANDGLADSNIVTVSITVIPENDVPVITSNGGGNSASISFAENSTATVATVISTDPDSNDHVLHYSLSGADAGLFSITSVDQTATLKFSAAPNFESPTDVGGDNIYNVIVRVTDNSGAFDEQALSVTVTNVNEAPVITSNGGGATASISMAENSTAVTTVVASDVDAGQTRSYSISGGLDAGLFSINSATGALSFSSAPNFENPLDSGSDNIYNVTVRATDNGSPTLFDEQALSVTVTNVNEAPVITSNGGGATASISIAEDSTAVTTVVASDVDAGQTRSYSISGGLDAGLFSINSATGALSFITAPDYENPTDAGSNNVYNVIVRATDNGSPTLFDEQALAVTVTDVADSHSPVIDLLNPQSDSITFRVSDPDIFNPQLTLFLPSAIGLPASGGSVASGSIVTLGIIAQQPSPASGDIWALDDQSNSSEVFSLQIGTNNSDFFTPYDYTVRNIIYGFDGGGFFTGGDKNDFLFGGNGVDSLDGGLGADQMIGGDGNDVYYVDDSIDSVLENPN